MATRFQNRRDTSANWTAKNPILPDGELGYEKDTGIVKMGNGVSTWNQLSPILGSSYLPLLGKAYDSERLDGLDSTAFALATTVTDLTSSTSASRRLSYYWGSGTVFPAAGMLIGDTFMHSGLKCLMRYNGTAWRQLEVSVVANDTERDALVTNYASALHRGFRVLSANWMHEYEPTIAGGLQGKWIRPNVWFDAQVNSNYSWSVPVSGTPQTWAKISGAGTDASFQLYIPAGRTVEVAWEIPHVSLNVSTTLRARIVTTDGGNHGGQIWMTGGAMGMGVGSYFATQVFGTEKLITVTPQAWTGSGSATLNGDTTSGNSIRLKYRYLSDIL